MGSALLPFDDERVLVNFDVTLIVTSVVRSIVLVGNAGMLLTPPDRVYP